MYMYMHKCTIPKVEIYWHVRRRSEEAQTKWLNPQPSYRNFLKRNTLGNNYFN